METINTTTIIKTTHGTHEHHDVYNDALGIRFAVFVDEQHVPQELEIESEDDEENAVHFVLYTSTSTTSSTDTDNTTNANNAPQPVGTVRLLTKQEGAAETTLVQRMAVLKSARGKGYGAQLFTAVIEYAQSHQIPQLTLHAQLSARGFYAKFDFTEQGEVFEEAGIQHITMVRNF
jgi:predicted GNAT family N-acyltransferase